MKAQRKATFKGIIMMALFAVVLVFMFMPVFDGHNAMEFLDKLYNSISKGSADYADAVREEILRMETDPFRFRIEMVSEEQARRSILLLSPAGVYSKMDGKTITIEGDLKKVLLASIHDSELMFNNDGESITKKYQYNEKEVLYNWWVLFNKIEVELTREKRFESANNIKMVQNRVIECSYNYYGIESQSIKDKYFIVIISLIFYVIYTVWYGFGIMHLFEGWGMKLGH
jgi:hypothetical protein